MALRFRARPGRLLALALAASAFFAVLGAGAAFAADVSTPLDSGNSVVIDLGAPVVEQTCRACHGNIAKTKNYSSEVIFSHGNHIVLQCSSCHSRFPHRPEGTERPTMKGCFDCHGLRHGSMGILATGKCEDCHVTPRERLRPAFHTFGWKGEPHVKPAEEAFNTRCAMCHTPETCTDCHDRELVEWAPKSWDYDAGDGCMSCHEQSQLLKQSMSGSKSFQVSGLELSAHRDLSCQQCHVDYRYDDKPSRTPLWNVNAGYACADCHRASEETSLSAPVPEWEKSIHGKQVNEGNFDAATCASCHGGHFINKSNTEAAKARMHSAAYRTCARCKQHGDDYDTYDDYYHGKAYKAGAPDAPACWQCHEAHEVLPSADPESSVNAKNVGTTCGQEGCHSGSDEQFGADAAALIHQKQSAAEENPLMQVINRIRGQ